MPHPNTRQSLLPETPQSRPTLAQLGPKPEHPLNPLEDPDPKVSFAERLRLYRVVYDAQKH
jgi:hypothetical protein